MNVTAGCQLADTIVTSWLLCGATSTIFYINSAITAQFYSDQSYSVTMMQTTSQPCAMASAPTQCRAAFACASATLRRSAHTSHFFTRMTQSSLLRSQHISLGGLQSRQAPLRAARQRVAAVRAETSYVMIKPDGVQRALVGEVGPPSSIHCALKFFR